MLINSRDQHLGLLPEELALNIKDEAEDIFGSWSFGTAGPGLYGFQSYPQFCDQNIAGRFDGENYQIGIVDVTQRPYTEFEEGIMQTHREIYDVVNGILAPTERKAEEIPAIFF